MTSRNSLAAKNLGQCTSMGKETGDLGALPQKVVQSILSKTSENTILQNRTSIVFQRGALLSYHMSVTFQKIDFQEFARSLYIFQEVTCILGGPLEFTTRITGNHE